MTDDGQVVAFWLRPAGPAKEFFSKLIVQLAERFDAPVYEAHVTLQVATMKAARATHVLDTLAARPPLHLEVERIEFSEEFTKTLYVQFRGSREAAQLSAEIADAADANAGYHFDPHLSLIYGAITPAEKERLARTIALPFQRVTFGSLQAVACPAQIRERADVEAWRTLGERALG